MRLERAPRDWMKTAPGRAKWRRWRRSALRGRDWKEGASVIRPRRCASYSAARVSKSAGIAPMVGVDPFDDPGPAQRLQPADMAFDIGPVVAAGNTNAAGLSHGAVDARAIVAEAPARDRPMLRSAGRGPAGAGAISTIDPMDASSAALAIASEPSATWWTRPSTPSTTRPSRSPSSSVSRLSITRPVIRVLASSP